MGFGLTIFILLLVSFSPYLLSAEKINEQVEIVSVAKKTGRTLTFKQLMQEIKNNQVIYIGENHDNSSHHLVQLYIIKTLYNQNKRIAIGMEMLQSKFQDTVNDYIFGNMSEQQFLDKTEYNKRWGYDYSLYKPIIDFAKTNNVPIIALNIESEVIKDISKKGISKLHASDLNKLPKHIDFTNNKYRKFLYEIFKDHPNQNNKSFEKFYSIQLVWDEFMAEKIDSFLKDNEKYQIVVLAGNGHIVHGYGIPQRLFSRNKLEYTAVLNDVEYEKEISDFIISSNKKADH
jgi:uncharacterized iron-regulated protein